MNKRLELLNLYNRPGGRYTYFPFHSTWNNSLTKEDWISSLKTDEKLPVDIYIHIPFCYSICTFCGCNIVLKKNRNDNLEYIEALNTEWKRYCRSNIEINSIYIGGGTPNFLTPEELRILISNIQASKKTEITIEIDPRFISIDDLKKYLEMGITNLSIGIQDFDDQVLTNVNRDSSEEEIVKIIKSATEIGFKHINLDFIYGLNFQSQLTIAKNLSIIKNLNIDSISLYPFAKVPWQKNFQKAFGQINDFTLEEMNAFYDQYVVGLEDLNFYNRGMGYFTKSKNQLERNIMGFTQKQTDTIIGLGVSAISSSPLGHIQNEKIFEKYLLEIKKGDYRFFKSHRKNIHENDLEHFFKKCICENFISNTDFEKFKLSHTTERFNDFLDNNIVESSENGFKITHLGQSFHKIILQEFDPRVASVNIAADFENKSP
jgi:oxygen-independent coproporphyrinogen-3 oxidase